MSDADGLDGHFTAADRAVLAALHNEVRILLPLVRWSFLAWAALAGVNIANGQMGL